MAICQPGALRYCVFSVVENPRWMTPSFRTPARFRRSSAPIHRSRSGLTGFFTSTGISVSWSASAISCMRKGLALERAPTQSMSTPYLRHSYTCFSVATSQHTFMPVSSLTFLSHLRPGVPTPSKLPGCVRGFQMPARNTWMPLAARSRAVSITCSSLSALQGPAITIGRGSVKNPHSLTGTISSVLAIIIPLSFRACREIYRMIFRIRFASSMSSRTLSSSKLSIASRNCCIFSM